LYHGRSNCPAQSTVSNWRKTVRPSADYKPFRTKPIGFVTTDFVSTIQSHGLEHLIDLTTSSRTQLWINSNVAGSTRSTTLCKRPLRKLSSSVIEGQGYSHPMEGDSRSLRQLHDSG
jgi:hypothetical protein